MADPGDRSPSGLTPKQRELLAQRVRRAKSQDDETAEPPATGSELDFGLFFFSDDGSIMGGGKYALVLEAARFADKHDFCAVWTPERHFQDFGGLYPNPSLLASALAVTTRRIGIRAGSVALPLHHPVRVAEEWAVVDNLSNGRAAISVATGWHPQDFILSPGEHATRKQTTYRSLQTLRRLWAGESETFEARDGSRHEVRIFPRPIQSELPIWLAISGNPESWIEAGRQGLNVLSTLVNQPFDDLQQKITSYQEALRESGHDVTAKTVTIMLHTFVGESDAEVRALVRGPMTDYLRTFFQQHEGILSSSGSEDLASIDPADRDAIMEHAFEQFFQSSALFGTVDRCYALTERLVGMGVTEIACLVDFGLDRETVLRGLPYLNDLRRRYRRRESR